MATSLPLRYHFDTTSIQLRSYICGDILNVQFLILYTMAKGAFATNTLAGKLGIYVFARRKGEQVSRSWVRPTDRKTEAQGQQRSTLANIIRVFQSAPSFFVSAFANKRSNQSDYNAFIQRNISRSPRIHLPKSVVEAGGGVVAPYVISDGGLQSIIVTGIGVTARTNIAVGEDFEITAATTVAELSAAILANNTFINEGDQLSYLSIEQYTDNGTPRLRARKFELVISTTGSGLALDYIPSFGLAVSGGFIAHGDFIYSGAFAWILSRNRNGKIDISRQTLIVTDTSLYSAYTSVAAINVANKSYGNTNTIFMSPSDDKEGSGIIPSNIPSVASVRLQGDILSPPQTEITLAAAGTIAAEALQITGSNFTGVTEISLTVYDGSRNVTATVPVTVESDTLVVNTAAVSVTNISAVDAMEITINGARVYSWHAENSGTGGDGSFG